MLYEHKMYIYIYIPFYPAVYTVLYVSKTAKNTTVRFNLPKLGTFMYRTIRKSAKSLPADTHVTS